MSFFNTCLVLSTLSVLISGHNYKQKDDKVSIDYYGRGVLRHTRVTFNCDLDLHKEYCRFKCSKSPAVCIKGNCYCVKGDKTKTGLAAVYVENTEDSSTKEFVARNRYLKNYPLNSNTGPNIYRRHHIAHFCPDLEKARICIRKCMKEGKPAFCGKDHVCYCGHKYDSHSKDKELNITAMYAQFKDLYDKYFNPKQSEEVDQDVSTNVDTGSENAQDGIVGGDLNDETTTESATVALDDAITQQGAGDNGIVQDTGDEATPAGDGNIQNEGTTNEDPSE